MTQNAFDAVLCCQKISNVRSMVKRQTFTPSETVTLLLIMPAYSFMFGWYYIMTYDWDIVKSIISNISSCHFLNCTDHIPNVHNCCLNPKANLHLSITSSVTLLVKTSVNLSGDITTALVLWILLGAKILNHCYPNFLPLRNTFLIEVFVLHLLELTFCLL